MKIKLDENLPDDLAEVLRSRHHDVDTVPSESLAGRDEPSLPPPKLKLGSCSPRTWISPTFARIDQVHMQGSS